MKILAGRSTGESRRPCHQSKEDACRLGWTRRPSRGLNDRFPKDWSTWLRKKRNGMPLIFRFYIPKRRPPIQLIVNFMLIEKNANLGTFLMKIKHVESGSNQKNWCIFNSPTPFCLTNPFLYSLEGAWACLAGYSKSLTWPKSSAAARTFPPFDLNKRFSWCRCRIDGNCPIVKYLPAADPVMETEPASRWKNPFS